MIWSNIRRRLKGADSSSSLPDSILAESSRSFRSVKSRSADPLAVCRQSWTVGSSRLRQCHVDHAQNGVHRRAQLVAHVGQELALGDVGGLGGFLGSLQRFFRPLAVGDVAGGHDRANDPVVLVLERRSCSCPTRSRRYPCDACHENIGCRFSPDSAGHGPHLRQAAGVPSWK